ncbi:MAG: hypothetical protein AMXMBFR53_36360 [Gemmatimonadota bacterium]
MRIVTAGEQTVLESAHYGTHLRVKVEDADGVFQDVTGRVIAGRVAQTVDQIVATAEVEFQMEEAGGNSLAPLDETSGLNVDALAAYAPLIDAGRGLRVEFATMAIGDTPTSGDWHRIFEGTIDEWDGTQTPMRVMARDAIGALIADAWLEEEMELGSEAGVAIETVMQEILTSWCSTVTLYTPTSPGFLITPYRQEKASVLDALQQLAALIGWVVEPRWDDTTGAFRLTFYEPDRTPASTDWVWAANRYSVVPRFRLSRLNVRNALSVWYTDADGVRQQYTVEDANSIAKYGRQWMEIEEGEESAITTAAEAQAMADAAVLDLKDPVAEQEIKTFCFWPIQLGDNGGFTANGVHYSEDQEFGVTGFRHEFRGGHISTFIQTRGKPAGFTTPWLKRGGKRRDPVEDANGLRIGVRVYYDEPTEGQVTITVTRGSNVYDVAYYSKTLTQPITKAKKPWPEDGDLPTGVMARGTDDLVLTAPSPNQIIFLQLEPRAADGKAGNPMRIEIHPKAVSTGADLPANGDIIFGALGKSFQHYGFTGTFSNNSATTVAWTSGTLTLSDGATYSIGSGTATSLSGPTTPTYIYFDPAISTTAFQKTTTWSADFGEDTLLIAVAWSGSVLANHVQSIGLLTLDGNAINPLSITTGLIAALAITAGKLSVASLSAISADLGTVTAGTIEASVLVKATTFTATNATYTGNLIVNGTTRIKDIVRFTDGGSIQVEDGRIMEFYDSGATFRGDIRAQLGGRLVINGAVEFDDAPTGWNMATEFLDLIDAGSTGATEQDWIQVEVGGITGYLRVYATK